ncbi:hypothetical protein MKW98_010968 [Papaver atlanticum]|uniref:FBD domain-containing protein n=1 Tax=Papaver atlanticum TaxID=357466 RepID=A0AAD4TI48_9MAGN|nr:hypothetical protein MKW98_010968 [Papaver atlanticum]
MMILWQKMLIDGSFALLSVMLEMTIKIYKDRHSAYGIPHQLLNCKSLRNLRMQVDGGPYYADIILPKSMDLPRLKFLRLDGFSISNVELSKKLFSSCPFLKTLEIVDCDIGTDDERNLTVNSLSLKKFGFVIYTHRPLQSQNHAMTKIIKLSAPNLKGFSFTSSMALYSLENCSPLSHVDFDMTLEEGGENENADAYSRLPSEQKEVYAKRMMKFLGAVSMVKTMIISVGFLEVVSRAPDLSDCQPPCLSNLQFLMLGMWSTRGCLRAIAFLLSISPNISKILVISKESSLSDVGDDWEAGLSLQGILSHLKYVHIREVEGCDAELKLLSFLLKSAKVLKQVVLHPRSTIDSPDRVRRQFRSKLRALPRASSHIIMRWPATKSTYLI